MRSWPDVTDTADVQRAVQQALSNFGQVDILAATPA
jgi:NAD(P)-dependent dehydrogenase (short-subunit alcohol dehydrogenase family)